MLSSFMSVLLAMQEINDHLTSMICQIIYYSTVVKYCSKSVVVKYCSKSAVVKYCSKSAIVQCSKVL